MRKDQEEELARLGLELLAEEGEATASPTIGRPVRGRNTDKTDVDTDAWTEELEKAENHRSPAPFLLLAATVCLLFLFLKWKNII